MRESQPSPVFELFDPTLAATMPEVMGLWATRAATTAATTSFSLNAAMMNAANTVDVPVWRANFPADFRQATLHLVQSETTLRQSQKALVMAGDRGDRLTHTLRLAGDRSFAPVSVPTLPDQPERELFAALQAIQQPDGSVNFGMGEELVGFSQRAFQQFQIFVARLVQVVAHYALVETRVEGRLLAQTSVGWLGDVSTIWQTGLGETDVCLHQRTLALTLASRDTLLQTFGISVRTALKLSALVSVPGGMVFVLPVAWQFIDRVLTQLREG